MRKDPDSCSFDLGQAHLRQKIRLPYSEHLVVLAPPRRGKSGSIGDVMLDYPGAVLSTTTRDDLFRNTSGIRARYGPIEVFNPQAIGHTPSTIRVNPVRGCASRGCGDPKGDSVRGGLLGKGTDDQGFWEQSATSRTLPALCCARRTS